MTRQTALKLLAWVFLGIAALLSQDVDKRVYQVCWVGPLTDDTFCGSPMTMQEAKAWAFEMNKREPIHHFVRETKGLGESVDDVAERILRTRKSLEDIRDLRDMPNRSRHVLDLTKQEKDALVALLKTASYGADETRKRIYNRILEELEKR